MNAEPFVSTFCVRASRRDERERNGGSEYPILSREAAGSTIERLSRPSRAELETNPPFRWFRSFLAAPPATFFRPSGALSRTRNEFGSLKNCQAARLSLDERKITVIPNKPTAIARRHQANRDCGAKASSRFSGAFSATWRGRSKR
jgi:hypothetical protein